ncbi:MAG: DNA starvation/stationary phase protection protein [Roseiflexaceae bacterium]|nr:DNA starvation/stationary phase protection protein [Roseiflexaceae bacterium]
MAAQKQNQNKDDRLNIGLEDKQRSASADILNRVLSDQHVLYIKTRKYHWNVTGRNFYSLHELMEKQYDQLALSIDEVAERSRSMGYPAFGTMEEFGEFATLKEEPGVNPAAMQMVANLVSDHEQVIRNLRGFVDQTADELHDQGTSDFLTGLMEEHEKMAWMLRAFLEDEQNV